MERKRRPHPWWAEEGDPFEALEKNWQRWMGGGWPRGWGARARTGEWQPAIDLFEKPDMLVLRAELPGVPQEAIDITLENGILTLKGERQADEDISGDEWLCCERPSGAFYRAVQLPAEIDVSNVSATYKDGVLTIRLPKLGQAKARKVNVKVG